MIIITSFESQFRIFLTERLVMMNFLNQYMHQIFD